MSVLNLSAFDLLIIAVLSVGLYNIFQFLWESSYAIYDWIIYVLYTPHRIYLTIYGVDIEPVYRASKISDFAGFESITFLDGVAIKQEGAFSSGNDFTFNVDGMPDGVFQVFTKVDDSYAHIGHGFAVANELYTAVHVVSDREGEIYIKTLKSKALKVKVVKDMYHPYYDVCKLECIGATAALGIKSLQFGVLKNGSINVFHFNPAKISYQRQSATPDPYNKDQRLPAFALSTPTTTSPSDSGLPVLQKGRVVALHIGGCEALKRNVHFIPVPFLKNQIENVAESYAPILKDLSIETESPVIKGDESSRMKAIFKENQHREEEDRRKRQRGEHFDEQGYRTRKQNLKPELNQKDDDGDQYDDQYFDDEEVARRSRSAHLDLPTRGQPAHWADIDLEKKKRKQSALHEINVPYLDLAPVVANPYPVPPHEELSDEEKDEEPPAPIQKESAPAEPADEEFADANDGPFKVLDKDGKEVKSMSTDVPYEEIGRRILAPIPFINGLFVPQGPLIKPESAEPLDLKVQQPTQGASEIPELTKAVQALVIQLQGSKSQEARAIEPPSDQPKSNVSSKSKRSKKKSKKSKGANPASLPNSQPSTPPQKVEGSSVSE